MVVGATLASSCVSDGARFAPRIVPVLPYDISELSSPIEHLGYQIYARDIAAWRATDAVVDSGIDLKSAGVRGWITVLQGSSALVRFVGGDDSNPVSLIDVSVDLATSSPADVLRQTRGVALSEAELSMWRARQLAASSDFRKCSDRYNTVVLRDPYSENWLVYLLAATTTSDLVVGGHHRFLVSFDGGHLLEAVPLSNACLTIPVEPGTKMVVFTQLASEEPLETSVLLSLQTDTPVMFSVPHGSIWKANKGHLILIRDGPAE